MRKLHFDYYMQLQYSEKVQKCHYTIKCIPWNTDRQQLEEAEIRIEPEDNSSRGEDSFGNQTIYGSVNREHDYFLFHITGSVATGILEYETDDNESLVAMYRYPYGLTKPGKELQSYYYGIQSDNMELFTGIKTNYEKASAIMHRLYQDFHYQKKMTNFATTAEEAWQLRCGVCQDYAHILISLCRMAGIPARYVAGMMIGEGYSHAWVEILSENRWYALDPTNDIIVTDSHIKIGIGRDASDCMINRGVLTGGGNQSQSIRVLVEDKSL